MGGTRGSRPLSAVLVTIAIFLDRDGVINRKAPEGEYVRDWNEFEFLPGAVEALRRLSGPGMPDLIVVTNQRGIALGHMTQGSVDGLHARMRAELHAAGATIRGIYVCPHQVGACDCRKPGLGMFDAARLADPSLQLDQSTVVGDSVSDIEAANVLGARALLIATQVQAAALAAERPDLRIDGAAPSLLEMVEAGELGVVAGAQSAP